MHQSDLFQIHSHHLHGSAVDISADAATTLGTLREFQNKWANLGVESRRVSNYQWCLAEAQRDEPTWNPWPDAQEYE